MSVLAPEPEAYLESAHRNKGIGGWRELYLRFLERAPLRSKASIVEIGAGAPDFLLRCPQPRKTAVDIGEKYKADFEKAGIEFTTMDLDRQDVSALGPHDIVVCSDVFEHLLWPHKTLEGIAAITGAHGALFSHVPNEYTLRKTVSIMLGRSNGMFFHRNMNEWEDPHIRRFTDVGFRAFLETCYAHNLRLTHLNHKSAARILSAAKIPVPFCLEGGPTYLSTNDASLFQELSAAARDVLPGSDVS